MWTVSSEAQKIKRQIVNIKGWKSHQEEEAGVMKTVPKRSKIKLKKNRKKKVKERRKV